MEQPKYPKLNYNVICKDCLGCSLLANLDFRGATECGNYIKCEKEEEYLYGSKYGMNN